MSSPAPSESRSAIAAGVPGPGWARKAPARLRRPRARCPGAGRQRRAAAVSSGWCDAVGRHQGNTGRQRHGSPQRLASQAVKVAVVERDARVSASVCRTLRRWSSARKARALRAATRWPSSRATSSVMSKAVRRSRRTLAGGPPEALPGLPPGWRGFRIAEVPRGPGAVAPRRGSAWAAASGGRARIRRYGRSISPDGGQTPSRASGATEQPHHRAAAPGWDPFRRTAHQLDRLVRFGW